MSPVRIPPVRAWFAEQPAAPPARQWAVGMQTLRQILVLGPHWQVPPLQTWPAPPWQALVPAPQPQIPFEQVRPDGHPDLPSVQHEEVEMQ